MDKIKLYEKLNGYFYTRNVNAIISKMIQHEISNPVNFIKIAFRNHYKVSLDYKVRKELRYETVAVYYKLMEHYGADKSPSSAEGIELLVRT